MSSITSDSILRALTHHIGRDKGIEIETLVWEACHREPTQARQRKAREVIAELREQGLHICAHPSEGYYMAANEHELNDTCEFLYARAMKSLVQIAAMKRKSLPDLRGQLNLLRAE